MHQGWSSKTEICFSSNIPLSINKNGLNEKSERKKNQKKSTGSARLRQLIPQTNSSHPIAGGPIPHLTEQRVLFRGNRNKWASRPGYLLAIEGWNRLTLLCDLLASREPGIQSVHLALKISNLRWKLTHSSICRWPEHENIQTLCLMRNFDDTTL